MVESVEYSVLIDLEILFGLSQILIGFLGCLCDGVSKPRRNQIV